jgi:hypothetical protein
MSLHDNITETNDIQNHTTQVIESPNQLNIFKNEVIDLIKKINDEWNKNGYVNFFDTHCTTEECKKCKEKQRMRYVFGRYARYGRHLQYAVCEDCEKTLFTDVHMIFEEIFKHIHNIFKLKSSNWKLENIDDFVQDKWCFFEVYDYARIEDRDDGKVSLNFFVRLSNFNSKNVEYLKLTNVEKLFELNFAN